LFSHSVTLADWLLMHSEEHSCCQERHWAALQPGYADQRSDFFTSVEEQAARRRKTEVTMKRIGREPSPRGDARHHELRTSAPNAVLSAVRRMRWAGFGLIFAIGCGEDPPPPPPPPTVLEVVVVDAVQGTPITGAEVIFLSDGRSMLTDASGAVSLEVSAGSQSVRVQAAGHVSAPEPFAPAPSAEVRAAQTTTLRVALEPRPGSIAGGTISGRVTVGGAPMRGVLVVAAATTELSSYTDSEGKYRLLGVDPGLYRVQAYLRAHQSTARAGVQIATGSEAADVDLELTAAGGACVGGMLGAGTTSVSIALLSTGDPVPGLSVAASGGSWSIDGVPEGQFVARAFLERDDRTVDPDLLRTRDEPVFAVSGTSSVGIDLPSAPVIRLVEPTETSSVTPPATFSWLPVDGADFYVIEVRNVAGQVLWGGLDAMRRPAFRVLGRTNVGYGEVVAAIEPLASGRAYQFRVYAGVETLTGSQFELIAASEELDGRFHVAR
jgi:hypothetical protein